MEYDISKIGDTPWDHHGCGPLISLDGCDTTGGDNLKRADVERVIVWGETGPGWDGESAGIALLKDGRYIAWESWWGPTGSGFSGDAYGGDEEIAFARTAQKALEHISEKGRELWPTGWTL